METTERENLRRALRHDLRNPLAVILGRCEILVSGAMGELSHGQARSVGAIQRNAERLVSMLDTLADQVVDRPEDD